METVALIAEQVVFVLALLRYAWRRLTKKGKKRKRNKAERSRWQVVTGAARKNTTDIYGSNKVVAWDGYIAVRVVRGNESYSMGAVEVKHPDFEAQIQKLTALGEERAASLNALDVYA